ncbi:integrase core domain-containing protein, partial [Phreatobacter sp.]|uniref:integrase core domain-containing protein n=1 Tax=Phreatobacter sp. TaxID=1966341 RepID=UPI003F714C80
RRALHKGHGGLMFNTPPTHENPDSPEARASIGRYLDFYNRRRPHQGLAGQTPDQAFIRSLQRIPAAA